MQRTAALLLLALFSPGAQSATVWKGTSTHSITSGSGDVLDTGGAAVTLSAGSMGESAFIGAITSLGSRRVPRKGSAPGRQSAGQ